MILLIDNFDSFSDNLARYLRQLGQDVTVVRNNAITLDEISAANPNAIVISPGPCTPDQAGISLAVVDRFVDSVPILGVCLGHQAICQSLGAKVVRSHPVHGSTSNLTHSGHAIFRGIESPFVACRYHSLVVDRETLPDSLDEIATCDDGLNMAVAHRTLPVAGVQFHPESILTDHGYRLLGNYLKWIGLDVDPTRLDSLSIELASQRPI